MSKRTYAVYTDAYDIAAKNVYVIASDDACLADGRWQRDSKCFSTEEEADRAADDYIARLNAEDERRELMAARLRRNADAIAYCDDDESAQQ